MTTSRSDSQRVLERQRDRVREALYAEPLLDRRARWRAFCAETDWRIWLARIAGAVGLVGYFTCWLISWDVERPIFGHAEFYRTASPTRPVAVLLKGGTFYLEPSPASWHNWAQLLIVPCLVLALAGGAYLQARARARRKKLVEEGSI